MNLFLNNPQLSKVIILILSLVSFFMIFAMGGRVYILGYIFFSFMFVFLHSNKRKGLRLLSLIMTIFLLIANMYVFFFTTGYAQYAALATMPMFIFFLFIYVMTSLLGKATGGKLIVSQTVKRVYASMYMIVFLGFFITFFDLIFFSKDIWFIFILALIPLTVIFGSHMWYLKSFKKIRE